MTLEELRALAAHHGRTAVTLDIAAEREPNLETAGHQRGRAKWHADMAIKLRELADDGASFGRLLGKSD